MNTIQTIQSKMAANDVPALLISDIDNIRWATGFSGSSAFVLLTQSEGAFLTDSRYTIQAAEEVSVLPTFSFANPKTSVEFISEHARRLGISKLAFERGITYDTWDNWTNKLNGVELFPSPDILAPLRMVKSAEEIEKIREACKLADACLGHIKRMIQPGVKEFDIGLEIEFFYRRHGAGLAFSPIVASGQNSARPHARATEKIIEVGDFVTIDCGCSLDGYCSDITRTFAVGEPSDRQRQIYNRVLESQIAAIEAIKPGVNGKDVDRISREVLDKDGLAKYFGHGLGHGLGRVVHDHGGLSPTRDQMIEIGQVWTVEPGVYIEGFGGVRIEDDVVVTANGCEILTSFPKQLESLPA